MSELETESQLEAQTNPVVPTSFWWSGFVGLSVLIGVNVEAFLSTKDAEHLGQWGDFIGGMLNPILSFLAFVGLIYTIFLQRRELALSREELSLTRLELRRSSEALEDQSLSLKQQRFESAFFGMVGVLNQIIENMDVDVSEVRSRTTNSFNGRDCFSKFVEQITSIYKLRSYNDEPYREEGNTIITRLDDGQNVIEYPHDRERMVQSYEFFYKKRSSDVGHYFRVLYNIFKYIAESEFSDGVYSKILRAQLSNQELVVLFYNCNSKFGKKFMRFAEKFQLFDNLNVDDLIRPEHINLVSLDARVKIPISPSA